MLTPKEEKFAQLYITLGNASEAYRQSYNAEKMKEKTIWEKASLLLKKDNVRARINELQAEQAKVFRKTREDVISDLNDIIDSYKKNGKFTQHTLKAIQELNKMMGWYAADKLDITSGGLPLIDLGLNTDEDDE